MTYATITLRKALLFLLLAASLTWLLMMTFSVKRELPPEYFSVDGLISLARIQIESIAHRTDYASGGGNVLSASALFGTSYFAQAPGVTPSSSSVARDIPVLLYHGITKEPDRFSMEPKAFKEHMFALKRAGYDTITLEDFLLWMEGKKLLRDKSILITFDDGRADSYYGADPIFSALGFNAVMFAATEPSLFSDASVYGYYLHRELLKKMLNSGRWEIGSHARQEFGGLVPIHETGVEGYFLSNKMWLSGENRLETDEEYLERINRELVQSKIDLEESLGTSIVSFAYPFGDFGQETTNNSELADRIVPIVESSYKAAFRQVWPRTNLFTSNFRRNTDTGHYRRIEPASDWTAEDLLEVLGKARAKELPYSDTFRDDKGWKHSWGAASIEDGELTLEALPETTGAFTFLDGSADWRDYSFTADVRREGGEFVSLIARFQDQDNYAACVFGDGHVKIVKRRNGADLEIIRVPDTAAENREATLGMAVEGSRVSCTIGERVAAEGTYAGEAETFFGGIGFQVWDRSLGEASARVRSLDVVSAGRGGVRPSALVSTDDER